MNHYVGPAHGLLDTLIVPHITHEEAQTVIRIQRCEGALHIFLLSFIARKAGNARRAHFKQAVHAGLSE